MTGDEGGTNEVPRGTGLFKL